MMLPAVHRESWLVVVTTLALVLYGVLQERVMTKGWGAQGELFPYSSFLVLSNRLLCVLVLVLHSLWARNTFVPVAPLRSYCLVSASNMVSTLCQYEALKYVSFVAQTLAKTAKALPVVLWGTLVGGKRYSARQYIHAILITGGCSIFVLGGDVTSGSAIRDSSWRSYAAGGLLLLAYLAADGWTSTQQEVLFKTHATPIREQLLYTTAFSTMYSLVATLASRQLLPALSFLQRHPDAAAAVLTLSLASTVIQVCISSVLQRHGALMFALMMTSRQCVSVLLSTVLFGHSLGLSQWVGIVIVFSALYHQRTSGSSRDKHGAAAGRSRLAIASGPNPKPHARDSDAAQQPLLQGAAVFQQQGVGAVASATTTATAIPAASHAHAQSKLAFRGSQGGINAHSLIPAAHAGHTALSVKTTPAGAAAEGGGGRVVGGLRCSGAPGATPSSPALMGPWRTASMLASHDSHHLVAVAEVQSRPAAVMAAAAAGSNNGMQQMAHRNVYAQQHAGAQHHSAGMVLSFPFGVAQPTLQVGSGGGGGGSALLPPAQQQPVLKQQQQQAVPPHSSIHLLEPGVPRAGAQGFDLRTLWSKGTGRMMVDPTTAVAMDHRDK